MKTALLLRCGGIGDILILTPIAKALHQKGYLVDYWCGSPSGPVFEMLKGLPYLNDVKEIQRVAGVHDCIKDEDENYITVEMLKSKYDEVFDFKYSVEDNFVGLNKRDEWRRTINSNYQNWIDLSLSWANIDPMKVSAFNKCPEIILEQKYIDWAQDKTPVQNKLNGRQFNVIGIQPQASTLIRTLYHAENLPELIHKKYPNDIVVIFAGKWICITPNGRQTVEVPDGYNPLLCSAALIAQMNCFISVDSGSSHIGEAVKTPTIGIYTTVPAWTRTKYYQYSYAIEANPECFPCFTLDVVCPIEKKKAEDSLTEREKDILDGAKTNKNPMDYAKKYNVPPKAIELEYNSMMQRLQAISTTEPACVRSITDKMILDKLDEVLSSVHQQSKAKILEFHEQVMVIDSHD